MILLQWQSVGKRHVSNQNACSRIWTQVKWINKINNNNKKKNKKQQTDKTSMILEVQI